MKAKRLYLLIAVIGFPLALLAERVSGEIIYSASPSVAGDRIMMYSKTGVPSTFAFNGLDRPSSVTFDSAGNLYTVNQGNRTIERFTPGGAFSVFASSGVGASTRDAAFDRAGNLFVINNNSNTIEKFSSDGTPSLFVTVQTLDPIGLAFDRSGNLYVSSEEENSIEKITPAGVQSIFATTGLDQPQGMAFDAAGNLYVANENNNTIEKFSTAGVPSVFASLYSPMELAFDTAGNLYAANEGPGGGIERFTPDGASSVNITGDYSSGIFALTTDAGVPLALPVPEPSSTLTLSALALGLLCKIRRRCA